MSRLRSGGALGPNDVYVMRPADDELLAALRAGQLCHVMASSRTGKTSLALRALRILEGEGHRVGYVDLTAVVLSAKGGDAPANQARFYEALGQRVRYELRLEDPRVPPSDATGWQQLLRDLHRVGVPIALVLDETNALLELDEDTREGFLASFKAFDSERARSGDAIAGICLIGFVSPLGLMTKPGLSPFNGSQGIVVGDFTLEEIQRDVGPSLEVADADAATVRALIEAVHGWTSGHPYMTAKLLRLATSEDPRPGEKPQALVDRLVEATFLGVDDAGEPVLDFAVKQLLSGSATLVEKRLEVYEEVLRSPAGLGRGDRRIAADLQFAGLASRLGAPPRLVSRNRILATRFDAPWAQEKRLALARPFSKALDEWLASGRSDDKLLGLAKIEEEIAPDRTLELSGKESEFLGRSVGRIARKPRRYARIATAMALMAALVIAVASRETAKARAERDDADRRNRESAESAAKAVAEFDQQIEAVQAKLAEAQSQIDECLLGDALEKEKLENANATIAKARGSSAATAIDFAAAYLDGVSADGKKLASSLRDARAVVLSCEHDRFACRAELGSRTTELGLCQAAVASCTKTAMQFRDEKDQCHAELRKCTASRPAGPTQQQAPPP